MCGRYSNAAEFSEIRRVFHATRATSRRFAPRLNISPTFQPGWEAPIVAVQEGERDVLLARFWFIPENWKRPLGELPPTFNARAETVFEKVTFRKAARSERCLVPATGWREFSAGQPYHFVPTSAEHLAADTLFAFAGMRSSWSSEDGSKVDSFAILTCEPTPEAREVHDRMPLILPARLYEDWLTSLDGRSVLDAALASARGLTLRVFASDRTANSSKYEGPLAIAPRPEPPLSESAPPQAEKRAKRARSAPPPEQLGLFQADAPLGSKKNLC